jgi:GNAT superfamily N-acetyltransferase
MDDTTQISVLPLTPDRWNDLERLFGERGACGGCWCMYWRLRRAEFNLMKGTQNRQALHNLAMASGTPGLLGYRGEQPVGWVALAPRSDYPTLERSRILSPVDDQPVWSIVCFYVDRHFRRSGLTVQLLHGVIDYARQQGANMLEGYPVDPKGESLPPVFVYTGLAPAFLQAGFVEVARRSPTRPIMRLSLEKLSK